MKGRYNIMMNTIHATYKGKYLATYWLNGELVTKPAYITDLLYCKECKKITLPQYCLECGDPCPTCQTIDEMYEFEYSDYDTLDELIEALADSGLEFNKFVDALEIEYKFREWAN